MALKHVADDHPEVSVAELELTLLAPDEVRASKVQNTNSRCTIELYYRRKSANPDRYITVVVKVCPDGRFLATGYTSSALKDGPVIFKKEVSE